MKSKKNILIIMLVLTGIFITDKLVSMLYVHYIVNPVMVREFRDSNPILFVPKSLSLDRDDIKQSQSFYNISLLRCLFNRIVFTHNTPYQKMAKMIHFGIEADGDFYYWSFNNKCFIKNNYLICYMITKYHPNKSLHLTDMSQ